MDLQSVAYFVAVVDHGGVTKAAAALYISQPSLSQSIRSLERRLGVALFDRTGGRLRLTDAGRGFDTAARRILADADRARARVEAVRTLHAGRVDVVTYAAFAVDPLVSLIGAFRARHPGVTVRVLDADGPDDVAATMRRGDAELALQDVPDGDPRALPLCEQELVLALPLGLADALPDPVPRARLADVPLVLDLGDAVHAGLAGAGAERRAPGSVIDCDHSTATRELVLAGAGGTVLPRRLAAAALPGLAVRPLDPPLHRRVGLTLRPGRPSPAAAAFASVARDWSGR